MSAYTIDPDGYGQPTLWRHPSWAADPVAVVCRSDVPPDVWVLVCLLAEDSLLGSAVRGRVAADLAAPAAGDAT